MALRIMSTFRRKEKTIRCTFFVPGSCNFGLRQPEITNQCIFCRRICDFFQVHQLHNLFIDFAAGSFFSPVLLFGQKSTKFLHGWVINRFSVTVNNLRAAAGSCVCICKIDEVGIIDVRLVNVGTHIFYELIVKYIELSVCSPFHQIQVLVK